MPGPSNIPLAIEPAAIATPLRKSRRAIGFVHAQPPIIRPHLALQILDRQRPAFPIAWTTIFDHGLSSRTEAAL